MIRCLTLLLSAVVLAGCGTTTVPPSSSSSAVAPAASTSGTALRPSSPSSPTASPKTPRPSPSRSGAPTKTPLPPIPAGAVPILYYHRVQSAPPGFATWSHARQRDFLAYDVLPAALAAQLDWIAANGYTTILPRDLAAHWDTGAPLPRKPVILTFDDGFSSWASTVLPMLRLRHMVAEFYLTLDAIATRAIGWPEVVRLAKAGNGIGAHDVHHFQLAMLPGGVAASASTMWHEIHDVRAIIAAHVGRAPDSMAYVGGGFDATLVGLVQKAGYTTARSIIRGIVQSRADRFSLRVVRVGADDDVLDPVSETLAAGLPTFTARMHGVSDIRR